MGLEVEIEDETEMMIDFNLWPFLDRLRLIFRILTGKEYEFTGTVIAHGEIEPPEPDGWD